MPNYFYPVERLTIRGVLSPHLVVVFMERLLIAEIAVPEK
jgi:hypothetical protein